MPTTIWEGIIQLILAIGIGGIIGFLGLWRANLKDLKAKIKQETKIELSLNASHERMDRMEKAAGNFTNLGDHAKSIDDHEHRIRSLENEKIKSSAWRGRVDAELEGITKMVEKILIKLEK